MYVYIYIYIYIHIHSWCVLVHFLVYDCKAAGGAF